MARNSPKHYYRCVACHSLIPTRYKTCASCGHDHTIIIVNDYESLQREFDAAIAARTRMVDPSRNP